MTKDNIGCTELSDFIRSLSKIGKNSFAKDVGVSLIYLYQIASGVRQAGAKLSMRIDSFSIGKVSREVLRPDIFNDHEFRFNNAFERMINDKVAPPTLPELMQIASEPSLASVLASAITKELQVKKPAVHPMFARLQ